MDKRIAHPDEEETVRRSVAWNRRWGQEYAGLFYQEELAGPEGMDVQVFVTEAATDDEIRAAEKEARQTQDVVGFGALVVPAEWLEEEDPKVAWNPGLGVLQKIVEDHTAMKMRWPDGDMLVDVTTANLVLQTLDAVKEPIRGKVLGMIERSKGDFLAVVDTAWKCVK